MCEKEGCDGIWNANCVCDITEEGSVMTGRPEIITPTEDIVDLRIWFYTKESTQDCSQATSRAYARLFMQELRHGTKFRDISRRLCVTAGPSFTFTC